MAELIYVGPEFRANIADLGKECKCKGLIYEDSIFEIEIDPDITYFAAVGLDIISMLRACEIMPYFNSLNDDVVPFIFMAATGKDSEAKNVVCEKIGGNVYEEVMFRKVPKQIIKAIIKEGIEKGNIFGICKPELITQEIRKGTMSWRKEFRKIGVRTPEEEDRQIEKEIKIISHYQPLLDSYFNFGEEYPDGFIEVVKAIIVDAVEKGFAEEFSDSVFIAAIATHAKSFGFKELMSILPFGDSDIFQKMVLSECFKSVSWLKSEGVSFSPREFLKELLKLQKFLM